MRRSPAAPTSYSPAPGLGRDGGGAVRRVLLLLLLALGLATLAASVNAVLSATGATAGRSGSAATQLVNETRETRGVRPPARATLTLPFPVPRGLRAPRASEDLPSLYTDGLACSVGCPPPGALRGWPLRPFHRQHPLRAGLNELRPASLHVGVDIQARDGAGVYALQPGLARVLAPSGPNARVQVGNFIYWHINPRVHTGDPVRPFVTELGTVMSGYGHLAFSEVDAAGQYVNPLRPGGRVLAPWVERAPPVLAQPRVARDGTAVMSAYDPQSFVERTSYLTPVLAPAAIAFRLYDRLGRAVTPLRFAFRGTHLLAWPDRLDIYAPGAHAPGYACFASHPVCRPHWTYWLAGGLASRLPTALPVGRYRLTAYAWDWADNESALDTNVWLTATGWRPRGTVPQPPARPPTSGLGSGVARGLAPSPSRSPLSPPVAGESGRGLPVPPPSPATGGSSAPAA